MLVLRLSDEMENRLADLAKMTGRMKTYYEKEAVGKSMDDLEDIYLSISRLENPGKRWSLEEVEKNLGLGG